MTDPPGRVSVDRKQNMGEIENNFTWQRKRFEKECKRAKDQGIKLIFLIEHGKPIKSIDDVKDWENPRLETSPYAVCGKRVHFLMKTFEVKYGVRWEFCDKRSTGRRIVELLKEEEQ